MASYHLEVLGLSETRWNGCGEHLTPNGELLLYSGKPVDTSHEQGVGILFSNKAKKCIINWKPISPRIITTRLATRIKPIAFNQCYAPTEMSSQDEKEVFYASLCATIEEVKKSDIVILMGDLNAKVGNDNRGYENIMGKHGLGTSNDNGELFMDTCVAYKLVIGGTIFSHKDIHKITWVSPD